MSKPQQKPTNARRPRRHQKASNVTDADGWTHVVRGPAAVVQRGQGSSGSALPAYTLGPAPLETVEELQAEHARQAAVLATREPTAPLMRALRRELEAGLAANPSVTGIAQAVCVGLGSLTAARRVTALRQLVAFEQVLRTLAELGRLARPDDGEAVAAAVSGEEKRDGEPSESGDAQADGRDIQEAVRTRTNRFGIPVYFQELDFTPLDEAFLSSRGYTVVSVPLDIQEMILSPTTTGTENGVVLGPIEAYMTGSTFFFAPHLEIDVINHAATKEPPLFYFGTNMKSWYERQEGRPTRSQIHRLRKAQVGKTEASGPVANNRLESHENEVAGSNQKPRPHWTQGFDWRAPGGIERLPSEEGAWASDFALAFRIS